METFLPWIALIVGGYLLGSVMFSRLVCLIFFRTDICKVSKDGNPGAANAFWHCGKIAGLSGLLLDMMKGFLPVFIAIKYLDYQSPLFILVMLAPVLGHAFSIFHNFTGGKCIATIYGELTAIFVTNLCPMLLVALGVSNILFEFVIKLLPGNKRAFVMFSILILTAIPACIYTELYSLMAGTIFTSMIAMAKHLPIYAPAENKRLARKRA